MLVRKFTRLSPDPNAQPHHIQRPRSIRLMERCTKHNIASCLIDTLSYNDLYLLVLSLDIAELENAINQLIAERRRARGIKSVKNLSPQNSVKFLKGG